jgi:hypothetical protein
MSCSCDVLFVSPKNVSYPSNVLPARLAVRRLDNTTMRAGGCCGVISAEKPGGGQASFEFWAEAGHCRHGSVAIHSRRDGIPMTAADSLAGKLCLACGLCCNGVLFKDVELQPGDSAARLRALGLPVREPRNERRTIEQQAGVKLENRPAKFPQPCAALCAGNRCRVYDGRPARCREFECALFKSVLDDDMELTAALRVVQKTRRQADKIRRLLRALGDTDEHLALSLRFKRTRRRMESSPLDEQTADDFGELSLAVHELNLLLGGEFYP